MEPSTRDVKLWEAGDVCEVMGLGGGARRGCSGENARDRVLRSECRSSWAAPREHPAPQSLWVRLKAHHGPWRDFYSRPGVE